ncbi:MAG: TPR end-of-group domain-containing protein [Planctomycetota bacterium]
MKPSLIIEYRNQLEWRARIHAVLGERAQAVALLEEMFQQGRAYLDWIHRDIDFESLWGYPTWEELMRPKG